MATTEYGLPTPGANDVASGDVAITDLSNKVEAALGPKGASGKHGHAWGSVPTWNDLPLSAMPGERIKVENGLGLCVAFWDGTKWRIDENSDTGWLSTDHLLLYGWTGETRGLPLRRKGYSVYVEGYNLDGRLATSAKIMDIPSGFTFRHRGPDGTPNFTWAGFPFTVDLCVQVNGPLQPDPVGIELTGSLSRGNMIQ